MHNVYSLNELVKKKTAVNICYLNLIFRMLKPSGNCMKLNDVTIIIYFTFQFWAPTVETIRNLRLKFPLTET